MHQSHPYQWSCTKTLAWVPLARLRYQGTWSRRIQDFCSLGPRHGRNPKSRPYQSMCTHHYCSLGMFQVCPHMQIASLPWEVRPPESFISAIHADIATYSSRPEVRGSTSMRCLDIRHHQRDRDKRHLAIEQSRILRMSGASFCDNGEYSLLAVSQHLEKEIHSRPKK